MSELKTFALPNGITCGKCGAAVGVKHTRTIPGLVIRERICQACGTMNKTIERVFETRDLRKYLHEPVV